MYAERVQAQQSLSIQAQNPTLKIVYISVFMLYSWEIVMPGLFSNYYGQEFISYFYVSGIPFNRNMKQ